MRSPPGECVQLLNMMRNHSLDLKALLQRQRRSKLLNFLQLCPNF